MSGGILCDIIIDFCSSGLELAFATMHHTHTRDAIIMTPACGGCGALQPFAIRVWTLCHTSQMIIIGLFDIIYLKDYPV